MSNARSGRLTLLGAAACLLATPFGIAATPAAATPAVTPGHHAAPATPPGPGKAQGHGWIGSAPILGGSIAHDVALTEPGTSPSQYAQVTFDAWIRVDRVELERRGTPAVADLLEARPWSWDDEWDETKDCEGAAGSTYCTWTGKSAQLTLRVANEQAAMGEPHAVTEAVLDPVPGQAVALWPYTTQKEADNSQKQVDEGHSPWQLYPQTVTEIYAENELGWNDPDVEFTAPDTLRVTDPSTGARVEVIVGQPARVGEGGIWAVTSLRSA